MLVKCLTLVFTLLLCGSLGIATMKQISVWKNSKTFWEYVVHVYPDDNPNALTNLGLVYLEEGQVNDAIIMFDRAVMIPPSLAFTHEGMGKALTQKGRLGEAAQEFTMAIQLDPRSSSAYRSLAAIHERLGKREAALEELRKAGQIDLGIANP
jgi:Tfp pilus assembly protein PilF